MKAIYRLKELIIQDKVIPFIGAGFSVPSGLPGWNTLINNLIKKSRSTNFESALNYLEKDNFNIDIIDISTVLKTVYSENETLEYFKDTLDDYRLAPNAYHEFLSNGIFKTIITTNWDKLIEKAFHNSSLPVNIICDDKSVPSYDTNKAYQVIKIHGTIESIDTLVYNSLHYNNFWERRKVLESLLLTLFSTKHILFLGYGFGDLNIDMLFDKLHNNISNIKQEHFALVYDTKGTQYWKRYNITPILSLDFDSSLNNYEDSTLKSLAEITSTTKSYYTSNKERSELINSELEQLILSSPPRPTIYMRGSLGWLSNPVPVKDDPIYGSNIQDLIERQMTELITKLLKSNQFAKVKCILHYDAVPLLKKYTKSQLERRYKELIKNISEFKNSIEIAYTNVPSFSNLMIIDEHSIISGYQTDTKGIQKIVINRDKNEIRNNIKIFDSDFNELSKPIDTVLNDLKKQIELLKTDTENQIQNLCSAISFAIENHNMHKQTREDKTAPYYIHILRVIERLREHDSNIENNILIAAALHDVVEDCNIDLNEIESKWNLIVKDLVNEMSNPENLSLDEYIEKIKGASKNAKLIRLADRLDNLVDLVNFNLQKFGNHSSVDYIQQSEKIIHIIENEINSPLIEKYYEILKKAKNLYDL